MFGVILVLGLAALVVLGAVRIVMGWVLPRRTVAKVDQVVGRAVKLYIQLCVVGVAGVIVWAIWIGSHPTTADSPPEHSQTAKTAMADRWDLADPDEERTTVPFTLAFAKKLRTARTLEDVQRLAGSKGKITERAAPDQVGFHWISDSGSTFPGYMLLEYHRDGNFGLSLLPVDVQGDVIVNSYGAFSCDKCKPPIDICGQRPSWIGADDAYSDPYCVDDPGLPN